MRITTSIRNASLVRQGLQDLSAEVPKIGRKVIYDTQKAIVKEMRVYPAERRNQKYVRTFRFRDGWTVTKISSGMGYAIENKTPYGGYVVGNAVGGGQAWMHVSTDQGKRWSLLRDVVNKHLSGLDKKIIELVRVSAKKIGFKVSAKNEVGYK